MPSQLRLALLWILIPAWLSIIVSIFDLLKGTSFLREKTEVEISEKRFAGIKQDLPYNATACYIIKSNSIGAYYRAAYALTPALIKRGCETIPPYLIMDCANQDPTCKKNLIPEGYTLIKEYEGGLELFSRRTR